MASPFLNARPHNVLRVVLLVSGCKRRINTRIPGGKGGGWWTLLGGRYWGIGFACAAKVAGGLTL